MINIGQFQHFSVVGHPGSLSKLDQQLSWPILFYPTELEPLGRSTFRGDDRRAEQRH
jgi:hypothetical protein